MWFAVTRAILAFQRKNRKAQLRYRE